MPGFLQGIQSYSRDWYGADTPNDETDDRPLPFSTYARDYDEEQGPGVYGFWETEPAENAGEGLSQSADNAVNMGVDTVVGAYGGDPDPDTGPGSPGNGVPWGNLVGMLGTLIKLLPVLVGLYVLGNLLTFNFNVGDSDD